LFATTPLANTKNTKTSNIMIQNTMPIHHVPKELLPDWMRQERTRVLTDPQIKPKQTSLSSSSSSAVVVYWMQREVRTVDNWALLLARHLAETYNVPLHVVYALPPPPTAPATNNEDEEEVDHLPPALKDMPMTKRYGDFLLGGLRLVHAELAALNIPLHVLRASSHETVGETVCRALLHDDSNNNNNSINAKAVICDFSPLRPFREWLEVQAAPIFNQAAIPLYQVDAHNIVPVWIAADKRQVGARTLRPRIHRVLPLYLQDFPALRGNSLQPALPTVIPTFEKETYSTYLQLDTSVPSVEWAVPGTQAGMKQYETFCQKGLPTYDQARNDPVQRNICSNLSPWINHGHISFQRIVLLVQKLHAKHANGTKAFIEEGVIRRELSDNYVYYTPNDYDELSAAAEWAQETLAVHANDTREYLYTLQELEQGRTHDDLWNAAQLQVVQEGGMHGFLRMYWAKKILEWTPSPTVALRTAQYFNDKYALDGCDPNGFVGVGWSIMGIHDMGWKEREVFGKIRFMNYKGCQRKFNVAAFCASYQGASANAKQQANHTKKPHTFQKKAVASSSISSSASGKTTAPRGRAATDSNASTAGAEGGSSSRSSSGVAKNGGGAAAKSGTKRSAPSTANKLDKYFPVKKK
jgi:deoxyribodipyrimidine photo-lyase